MTPAPPGTPSTPSTPTPNAAARPKHRPLARDHGGDARSHELVDALKVQQRTVSEQDGSMVRSIAEFDRAEAWRGDGALSMKDWLVGHLHIGGGRAHTLVAASKQVDKLPRLCDALCAGRITLDVFAPLAEECPAELDAQMATEAVTWTPKQAREWAAHHKGATDEQGHKQQAERWLRCNDEKRTITAQLPKDTYAAVKAALAKQAKLPGHVSKNDPSYQEFQVRLADALVECCTGGRGMRGGVGITLIVHTNLERLIFGDGYGHASIDGVGPISAADARRLACDAEVIFSFEGQDGTILDQKPLQRDPTTAQRIEIARRDQGCRYPGCGCTMLTDVHHVVWASKQGPTVLSNLLTLCKSHHSIVHENGWSLDGDANGAVTFTSPQGHRVTSVPSPAWPMHSPMRR
jgi:Domain of unknown function (DUF222)